MTRTTIALFCLIVSASCGGTELPTSPTSSTGVPASTPTQVPTTLTFAGSAPIIGLRQTLQLTASIRSANSSAQDRTASVRWASSNTSVATVSSTGVATSQGFGLADVTAEFEGASARVTITVSPVTFVVTSEGASTARVDRFEYGCVSMQKSGSTFYLECGGGSGGRGFNIAVIDASTGNLIGPVRQFDTWGTRPSGSAMTAMAQFINGQANGTLLLIAVADDAGINCDNSCAVLPGGAVGAGLAALRALGATQINGICFRWSYALIAVKGAGARTEGLLNGSRVSLSYSLGI